jgi:hypothetical protein
MAQPRKTGKAPVLPPTTTESTSTGFNFNLLDPFADGRFSTSTLDSLHDIYSESARPVENKFPNKESDVTAPQLEHALVEHHLANAVSEVTPPSDTHKYIESDVSNPPYHFKSYRLMGKYDSHIL